MPTYGYECRECGYSFERVQNMSDEPVRDCPECGKAVRRIIFGGSGVIFKGSGFYVNDSTGQESRRSRQRQVRPVRNPDPIHPARPFPRRKILRRLLCSDAAPASPGGTQPEVRIEGGRRIRRQEHGREGKSLKAGKAPRFFCEHCGAEVGRDERACPECGRFFSAVRCPRCGFSGSAGKFADGCPVCGYSMPAVDRSYGRSSPHDRVRRSRCRCGYGW